jgi:hypothetical protein
MLARDPGVVIDVFIIEETKKIFIKFTAKKSFSSVSGFDCKSR